MCEAEDDQSIVSWIRNLHDAKTMFLFNELEVREDQAGYRSGACDERSIVSCKNNTSDYFAIAFGAKSWTTNEWKSSLLT